MCQHLDSIRLIEMKRSRSISKFMQYVDCLKLIGVFNSWQSKCPIYLTKTWENSPMHWNWRNMNDPWVSTFLIENCVEKKLWVTSRRFSHITNYQVVCEFHCFDDFLECTLDPQPGAALENYQPWTTRSRRKWNQCKSMMRSVLQCEARRR